MEKKLNIILILIAVTLGISILSYVVLLAGGGYISLFKSEAFYPRRGNDLRGVDQAPIIRTNIRGGTGGLSEDESDRPLFGVGIEGASEVECKQGCVDRCFAGVDSTDSVKVAEQAKKAEECRQACTRFHNVPGTQGKEQTQNTEKLVMAQACPEK